MTLPDIHLPAVAGVLAALLFASAWSGPSHASSITALPAHDGGAPSVAAMGRPALPPVPVAVEEEAAEAPAESVARPAAPLVLRGAPGETITLSPAIPEGLRARQIAPE